LRLKMAYTPTSSVKDIITIYPRKIFCLKEKLMLSLFRTAAGRTLRVLEPLEGPEAHVIA
jgi:hypothetical protein